MIRREGAVRQFGTEPGGAIIERPGAYAIIVDERSKIAVVRVPDGVYLPGGGIERGESVAEALRREVLEETGLEVEIISSMGVARQYAWRVDWYNKIGHYFVCRPVGEGIPSEPDHTLEWWSKRRAMSDLTHEAQRWMIERVGAPC